MQAETFFTVEDKESIRDAIAAVERTTTGEVAVMVVDRSDTYPEGAVLAGVILGGVVALILTDLLFADSLWYFVPVWAVWSCGIGWLAGQFSPLKRIFLSRTRLASEVQLRALRAFYEKGLYKTRDATGVLFFISLFERKVWILADKGIHAKISGERLQAYAHGVARAIKEGRAAVELCAEIAQVGRVLAEHFPARADDINELSDEVLTESSRR